MNNITPKYSTLNHFWKWVSNIDLFNLIVAVMMTGGVIVIGIIISKGISGDSIVVEKQKHSLALGAICRRENFSILTCMEKYPGQNLTKLKMGWDVEDDNLASATPDKTLPECLDSKKPKLLDYDI